MFGLFKKKKQDEKVEFTEQEKQLYARGEQMLSQLGPEAYLHNLSIMMCSFTHNIHPVEVYGHINACINIGASGMVSGLSQIAAWQLAQNDAAEEVQKEFIELGVRSTMDCVEWMKEHGKGMVYQ